MTPKTTALTDTAPVFAALGDETRLRLVARLCSGGPQSIAALTAGLEVTRQAVTKHLLVLAGAGLLRSERQGRESRWELEPDRLEVARRCLDQIAEEWTDRLGALARHLDATPESPRNAVRSRAASRSSPRAGRRRGAPVRRSATAARSRA